MLLLLQPVSQNCLFFLLLQLLFTDTQVGSLATGLEVAVVVGKMEGGGWVLSAGTAEMSVRTQVHSAQQTLGVGKPEGVGEASKGQGQGQGLLELEPLLRP